MSAQFIDYACSILVKYVGIKRAKDIVAELQVGPNQNASVRASLAAIARHLEVEGK